MTRPPLHLATAADARPESVAQRVARLQSEARALARDHVEAFRAQIDALAEAAAEIAAGGDAFNPGVRDLARRLSEDLAAKAGTLEAINARSSS